MAEVNPNIFRAYDIRGLAEGELGDESVEKIAGAFASMLRERGADRVVLGRDCRLSSLRLRDVFARALSSHGVSVVDVGEVPTPLTNFAAATIDGIGGSVMITGSHNPPAYNGFKLSLGTSPLYGEEIQELRRRSEAGGFPSGEGKESSVQVLPAYLRRAQDSLRLGTRKLRVVVDGGNGVGGPVALELYRAMGMMVEGLYIEPDGSFPNHHPDPSIPENLADLRKRVLERGADLGIAFDGDADRVGVVDEVGNILWGDELMILYSKEVLKEEPGAVIVGEVKCSQTMFDEIAREGGHPLMWKAGYSWIKAKMEESGAALGGEMSGHIFFRNRWLGFDDGVYAGARLLEILSHEQRSLSELVAESPKTYSTPEIRREVGSEARKFALVEAAVEAFRGAGLQVNDIDGARVSFEDGFGLVRASNTQPILILRFEAKSEARLEEIRALFEETLSGLEAKIR